MTTMLNRLRAHLLLGAALAFVAVPLLPMEAEAQQGSRFQVMVANLQPTDGSSERWGRGASDEIRDRLDFDRHVAMSERDADDAARQYDMRFRDMECIEIRQLADVLNVPLVMCGTFEEQEDGQYRVDATIWTVPGQEELPLEPVYVESSRGGRADAARGVIVGFEALTERLLLMDFCQDSFIMEDWEEAATNYCPQAVELLPEERTPRFQYARALAETERYAEALEQFEILIEWDEHDDRSLNWAGYTASRLEQTEKAQAYYSRYLEMNPDDVQVRITIAYELAQAGEPLGAMEFVAVGLEQDPDNVELLESHGAYAFRAAQNLRAEAEAQAQTQDGDATLPQEVEELYRTATTSLLRAFELEGEDSNPQYPRNAARAFMQLDDNQSALDAVLLGIEYFPDDYDLHSTRATVESRLGNVDQAVASLERALELNPDLQNAYARMGRYYIDAERVDEAIQAFRSAADAGEQDPDGLAGIILNRAFQNHIQPGRDIPTGVELVEAAKEFNVSAEFRNQLDFFHGYGLMQYGIQVHEPQTLESARRALPVFQQAKEYMQAGEAFARDDPAMNFGQLMENVDIYIEIQEAIIRREGRR